MAGARAVRERLLGEMEARPVVDCHSHTMLRRFYYQQEPERSLFTIRMYFSREIENLTGRPHPQFYAGAADDRERWQRLRAALARNRNVSYWRHHIVTYQRLFDFQDDDLDDDNWEALNRHIVACTARPDWYDYVTRTRANLVTQVRNVIWFEDWEPEFFTPVLRMEPALQLYDAATRQRLEAHLGRELRDLPALHRGLADLLAAYAARGTVGIKLAHAYTRSLAHEHVPAEVASALYDRAVQGETLTPAERTAFQDHIVWQLTRLVADQGLIFQIHTGLQGNWGHIPDSNPLHLLPLIKAHRSVQFDLFHAGYPYAREMGVLGKHYPNVWLNACWLYLMTMAGSRQILSEWLDLVPMERLLGFGSDVRWPELVYGHLVMARECLADVLAEKVERDFLSASAASDAARLMLLDAPLALYGLPSPPT